jgi:hypothetical protein
VTLPGSREGRSGPAQDPPSRGDLCRVGASPVRASDLPRSVSGYVVARARVLRRAGPGWCLDPAHPRSSGPQPAGAGEAPAHPGGDPGARGRGGAGDPGRLTAATAPTALSILTLAPQRGLVSLSNIGSDSEEKPEGLVGAPQP